MNKILIFLILTINSVFIFGQTKWKTISENNFKIEYPDNWELNKSGQMGTKFILFSQLSNPSDKFRENINLIIQDLTGSNITLDEYVEISENQIRTLVTNGKIIESRRISEKEFEHQKIIYTGKLGVFDLKFIQCYWVIDSKAFVLTFTTEINEFDNFIQVGEKIMKSFKILR